MARELIAGFFEDETALLEAARAARARGLAIHDAYTPFAVHGLDEAMGLPRPILAKACFAFGLSGMLGAFGFQLWTAARDWTINVGGKTFTSIPALIPVTFEMTILAAAVGTFALFLLTARLWPGRASLPVDPSVTSDRFVLALEGRSDDARAMLDESGAIEIREIEAPR